MKKNLNKIVATFLISTMLMTSSGCNQVLANANNELSKNDEVISIVSSDGILTYSHIGGLYENSFDLELSSSNDGIIRYSLDGSDLNSESTIYKDAIKIYDRTNEDNDLSAILIENKKGPKNMEFDRKLQQNNNQQEQNEKLPNIVDEQLKNNELKNVENIEENKQNPKDTDQQFTKPENDRGRGGGMGGEAVAPSENVFKGTVVKAAVFSESGEQISETMVQSYFVGENILSKYELPVVSIVTDKANFYDEETGLYTNYEESGSEWERPVHFEMYTEEGMLAVSQYMGVRLSGNSTRSYQQKSMRFYAKDSYDENHKKVEYEIFDGLTKSYSDEPLTTFKRVLLRNSGNDNSSTMIRDALMQELVSDLNLDTQAYQPCVAFVNGEFWGIYNIRERYDDQYFANHYDIDKDKVALFTIENTSITPVLDEGDETDLLHYETMWNFFNENSMTEEKNYKKALEYIDEDNFIDYYIANIYSGNTDWPGNNNVFWRYKTVNGEYDSTVAWYMDGRYRWVIKDMDFGFGFQGSASNNTLTHATSEEEGRSGFGKGNMEDFKRPENMEEFMQNMMQQGELNPQQNIENQNNQENIANKMDPNMGSNNRAGGEQQGERVMGFTNAQSTLIFRKLLENETFKNKFINRFCDVMNTNYEVSYVLEKIDEYISNIETVMPEHINRYNGAISSLEEWEQNIEKMKTFVKERASYVQEFLKEKFELSDVVTISLKSDEKLGYIKINEKEIRLETNGVSDQTLWAGSYFAGTTQTLEAISTNGGSFQKFVVTDTETGKISEYTENIINIKVGNQGMTIQAIFE